MIRHPFVNVLGLDNDERHPEDICALPDCTGNRDDHIEGSDEGDYVYHRCPACGFNGMNIPTHRDEAHGELCCGTIECSVRPNEFCATHEKKG